MVIKVQDVTSGTDGVGTEAVKIERWDWRKTGLKLGIMIIYNRETEIKMKIWKFLYIIFFLLLF